MTAASYLSLGNVVQMDINQFGHANSLRFFYAKKS